MTWDEEVTDIIADNKLLIAKAKEAAQEINDDYDDGLPVMWTDVLDPMSGVSKIDSLDVNNDDEDQ